MGTYKLLALDMDGTLLNEESLISEENRQAIHAALEAGVTVIFSTGRGVQSALPFAVELGLQTPMITANGSEIWRAPGNLLKRHKLSADLVRRLHTVAVKYDSWWWAYAVEGMYNTENWIEDIDSPEWLKFGFFTENLTVLSEIRQLVAAWGELEITNSHPSNLEINPRGISKASGLLELCEVLNISMSEVVAMGDSENDTAMIRKAGLGVAMGNAQEGVKLIADHVTVTNNEHAVAKIIYDYILT
ncbi:Cof-type HAD-IIB family hydrolase [Paenibacillus eucommiae]|uniref:HAD superfamily hydrolase (TIGR01484 family) n=1 Tax=Paenibacillus eucommiae TaxID=1355755 RepID=A0ABS4IWS3_9BACL|nr:Cof-type HAD-IIB family hydrolase [Paenibacillus eucommiae]MBP1992033.1 HAD superfamily hydrolase (TIGR01484 family) [Paenibacillus eucommiae]